MPTPTYWHFELFDRLNSALADDDLNWEYLDTLSEEQAFHACREWEVA